MHSIKSTNIQTNIFQCQKLEIPFEINCSLNICDFFKNLFSLSLKYYILIIVIYQYPLNYKIFAILHNVYNIKFKEIAQESLKKMMNEKIHIMCAWDVFAFIYCSKIEYLIFKGLKRLKDMTNFVFI